MEGNHKEVRLHLETCKFEAVKVHTVFFFHDIEALHKCLVNKFGLFSSFSVLLTLAEMKIISGL